MKFEEVFSRLCAAYQYPDDRPVDPKDFHIRFQYRSAMGEEVDDYITYGSHNLKSVETFCTIERSQYSDSDDAGREIGFGTAMRHPKDHHRKHVARRIALERAWRGVIDHDSLELRHEVIHRRRHK